jgi:hypothetical protein
LEGAITRREDEGKGSEFEGRRKLGSRMTKKSRVG